MGITRTAIIDRGAVILLHRLIRPAVPGSEFLIGVAMAKDRDDDLWLWLEGQDGAGLTRGWTTTKRELTLDGILHAAEYWRSRFLAGGWVEGRAGDPSHGGVYCA